jgi:serine/threonine protein kinase
MINQKTEEEIYIINELIGDNYISIADIIKTNGGLLMIPELFNTDMSFYLIRFWGRKILTIFNILNQLNISLKYITLNDLYISKDGSEVKLRCIYHYSFFNNENRITAGPDIEIIKTLYTTFEQQVNQSDNLDPKVRHLNDSFIAPEYLLKDQKNLTNSMDTWIFGCVIFSLLFGKQPISFISQLKDWCDNQTNLIFEKIVFPLNIINEHFFYFPFKNCFEDSQGLKHLIESVKLRSYSAIIPRKYLNNDMENNIQINGLGLVLDMIASCLSVNPNERLDLVDLFYSDLFKFDNYETLLVNKFASNTLQFYSPDITVVQQMLLPLRNVNLLLI